VRSVEEQLNAGAAEFDAPSSAPPAATETVASSVESVPFVGEPGGETADAVPAAPPRQPTLPGVDRI
jgi:hypothetical protein